MNNNSKTGQKIRLMDLNSTATYLGLSEKTLRNRLYRGAANPFPVKPKRIGRKVLFDKRDLDRFIDSLPTTP